MTSPAAPRDTTAATLADPAPGPVEKVLPYGSWPSPITAESLTVGSVGLDELSASGEDLFWLEGRPSEAGRSVLVRRRPGGPPTDVTPAPFNVRNRVHEYGGGGYAVHGDVVVFSHFVDSRLYRIDLGGEGVPVPITVDLPGNVLRFADLTFSPDGTELFAVREDHRNRAEAENTLVRLNPAVADQTGDVLVDGHDFVSSPRPAPDGRTLAFLTWEHPDMPWDATILWTASVTDQGLAELRAVAGHDRRESLGEPGWLPDGRLVVSSDRSDWWNLYLVDHRGLTALFPRPAEFTGPAWVFGQRSWASTADGKIICHWHGPDDVGFGRLDPDTGTLLPIVTTISTYASIVILGSEIACLAGYSSEPVAVVSIAPDGTTMTIRRSVDAGPDPALIAPAEPVSWPTPDGATSFGFLYRPRNPSVAGPPDDRPPLLLLSHGGPTGSTSATLNLAIQYWTSRGIAVLDVNYGGSTGYGRRYRERLDDRWGIVDVDDCCSGATSLVGRDLVDANRLAIRGGSAGGYTTLAALTFRDVFKAGASLYGIGDLELLARDTHKFESRYLDALIGPYPEAVETYHERSPIYHLDQLSCPMILLQGADDRVVPQAQADEMATAVRAKGLPVALLVFEGEGHGFRQAPTIIRALEAELSFYGQVFGFTPADPIESVLIDNL